MLIEMINASEASENDPELESPVYIMFEQMEEKDSEHLAVRQYKKSCFRRAKRVPESSFCDIPTLYVLSNAAYSQKSCSSFWVTRVSKQQ